MTITLKPNFKNKKTKPQENHNRTEDPARVDDYTQPHQIAKPSENYTKPQGNHEKQVREDDNTIKTNSAKPWKKQKKTQGSREKSGDRASAAD